MFIERRAVEPAEPVDIGREMAGHPVEKHADIGLVEGVHQPREARRIAVARGRRIEADRLVTPGAVERVLGHGQELDMGEAHVAAVVHEFARQRVVVEEAVALARRQEPRCTS